MEAPIRTNQIGLLLLVVVAALTSYFAQPTAVSAAPASTNTGVRTNKAIPQKRPPAKSIYRLISLPQEVAGNDRSTSIVDRAKSLVGMRYRYGGNSLATGFDCSGLALYTTGRLGSLPRSANGLYRAISRKVSTIHPGDIVFFGRGRASHVGIYAGGGKVIHASTPRTGVRYDSFTTLARALGYMGAGQI